MELDVGGSDAGDVDEQHRHSLREDGAVGDVVVVDRVVSSSVLRLFCFLDRTEPVEHQLFMSFLELPQRAPSTQRNDKKKR